MAVEQKRTSKQGMDVADLDRLWLGAGITAVAAGLFPRLNAVIHEGVPIWQLDPEARILLPLVVVLPIVLFTTLGRWAWRESDRGNRPARVGLVCSVIGFVGFVAFFLSMPITLGGLAMTLGLEGRRRASTQGSGGSAAAATVLGAVGIVGGAAVWLLAGSI